MRHLVRLFAALTLVACSLVPSLAQEATTWYGVRIQPADRVPNRTGSQCVFSSLEALARHHKITSLYDLTQKYHSTSGPPQVAQILSARGVRFKQATSSADTTLIVSSWRDGLGCLVGLGGQHAIVAAAYDGNGAVMVIDNGGPKALQEQVWTWQTFAGRWDGWCVVLYPEQKPAPPPPPPGPAEELPRQTLPLYYGFLIHGQTKEARTR